MAQCKECGKECSILFEEEGAGLCWLCSSRKKARDLSEEFKKNEEEFDDRRAWKRYPVQIHLKFYYGNSENSKVIFPGTTVNLSGGGLCVEWVPCETCSGYLPGGIDPGCIFARYSQNDPESELLYVSLFLSEDDVINITAKTVFVIKRENGNEYIGLSFVDLDSYTRERIEDIINQILTDG